MSTNCKIPVHVEVCIRQDCPRKSNDVALVVKAWLEKKFPIFQAGILNLDQEVSSLVQSITVDLLPGKCISFWQAEVCVHPYRLSLQGPENDFLEGEEELPAAEQWELPNALLVNLWDSIVIESTIKMRLLSYCSSSIQFSEAKINSDIISWNRMILLHGPPGTGKTTICKGLAQKTFIRNSDRYTSGILLEVNSHSLFSKWFSESGKLVMKLFSHISEIADDPECLVIVLIDEVESITASRSSASSSNEPGDAVRVVNAVLTSLDSLKRRPNVLVLCTSNLIASVDPAFLDRVDMKIHLGPPPVLARYNILHSCLMELMNKKLIAPTVAVSDNCANIEEQLCQLARNYEHSTAATTINCANISGESTRNTKSSAHTIDTSILTKPQCLALLTQFINRIHAPDFDMSAGGYGLEADDQMEPAFSVPIDTEPKEGCLSKSGNSHSHSAAAVVIESSVSVGRSRAQPEEVEMYWLGSQEQEWHSSASSSGLSSGLSAADSNTRMDETAATADTRADIPAGRKSEADMIIHASKASGTAYSFRLKEEQYLYVVAALCEGMSGRALRKLPIKAHSYFLQRPQVTMMDFIAAMHATIVAERVTGTDIS